MSSEQATAFTAFVATRFSRRREEIIRAWVEELSQRLGIRPRRVLPTRDLLDHMPQVIEKISQHLRAGEEPIEVKDVVTEELASLARLRWEQGYDIEEVLREFEILGRMLDALVVECVEEFEREPDPRAVALVAGWLHRSLQVMGTVTASAYRQEDVRNRSGAGRLLRNFADTLLHQLKTPLGAAEGAALLLENEEIAESPDERRRFAEIVQRNLRRARAVIDDVRELALAESSYATMGRKLSLRQVVQDVGEELGALAEQNDVRIEVEEPVPEIVVDASRVEIILLNLVSNAIKYADSDKPHRWVRVGFSCRESDDEWWAYVRDNGRGIPEELHERVFQRFFRAHAEVAEGTGLGLAIVREAAEQMGAGLQFNSQPGEGTVFRFSLPRPAEEVRERSE